MVERLWKKLCDYPADGEQKHSVPDCFELAAVSDLVEALSEHGEVLKDATIRDKRGKYRNGDFLVVPLGEDAE